MCERCHPWHGATCPVSPNNYNMVRQFLPNLPQEIELNAMYYNAIDRPEIAEAYMVSGQRLA